MEESPTPVLDVLLHPIRWRIVQRVLGREVTTTDLRRDLPDVPTTTLYRHVAALIDAGYLTVVRERKIRGTTERTLSLDQTKVGRIDEREARAMTPDQHRQAFLMMLTRLAADFDRVLDNGDLYPRLHQLGYSQLALYMAPEDLETFRTSFEALIHPYLTESPGKDRIVLSLFSLPDS
ncbi:helix-turn-helix domain-containing protein [Kribbella shirazensis]|uniref:DNA-binding transcriptional ArsR family regulator n=1 Tax=Kribbella shirazensis TaxID=1105143 RepID=A0A7X5VC17_9ACTN|nr:helix-turn-helix domain-containing protein [Kribbella shirazensis]NIK57668.1 DNA-binding transcriptional ArsR family regulator [Kribbella shirazensis]